MSGLHFMGEVPYTHIYLHGTVRDTQHRKMSKSLGNGIDPLEVVERYGADALRYSLVSGMSVGTDVILDPDDLEGSFAAGPQLRQQAVERRAASSSPTSRARPAPLAGAPRRGPAGRADAGRPLDHRAVRRHRARGHRGLREVPAQRGGRRGLPVPLERSGRLVHRADQAPALRRRCPAATSPGRWRPRPSMWRSGCSIRSCRSSPRRSGAGFPAGRRTRRSRWRPGPRPDARARGRRGAGANSGWCSRWWAPSAASAPSTACSRGRRSAPFVSRDDRRAPRRSSGAGHDRPAGQALGARPGREPRAGRRPRGAARRHRRLRPAGRRHRRRPRVRPAGRRGRAARPRWWPRRRRSSATSSSWPAPRPTWSRASARSWRRGREQREVLVRKRTCWGAGEADGADGEDGERGEDKPVLRLLRLLRLPVASVLSCARIEPPPGGPPDRPHRS